MRNYKVQLTPRARTSITRIISYLEEEVSKTAAQKIQRGIMDTIRKLKILPESHEVFEDVSDEQTLYRSVSQWKYKIVFTVNNDILEVVVVQVYHGARGSKWIQDKVKY